MKYCKTSVKNDQKLEKVFKNLQEQFHCRRHSLILTHMGLQNRVSEVQKTTLLINLAKRGIAT